MFADVISKGLALMMPYVRPLAETAIRIFERALRWEYDGEFDLAELIEALEYLLSEEDE
jgi:hypothetical protein